jgi:hypothetical protein
MDVNDLENCPLCGGNGLDPDKVRHDWQPRPSDPATAEFELDTRCRRCGGNGRVPKVRT